MVLIWCYLFFYSRHPYMMAGISFAHYSNLNRWFGMQTHSAELNSHCIQLSYGDITFSCRSRMWGIRWRRDRHVIVLLVDPGVSGKEGWNTRSAWKSTCKWKLMEQTSWRPSSRAATVVTPLKTIPKIDLCHLFVTHCTHTHRFKRRSKTQPQVLKNIGFKLAISTYSSGFTQFSSEGQNMPLLINSECLIDFVDKIYV